ncbi:MAG: T9SS type A sorting domain-containing protein [Bacteroidales bacterium]|nr:T9SS type A sorting domain-containing protein [Bacteroidales bacterium]
MKTFFRTFLVALFVAVIALFSFAQQWPTTGGNNMKNGQSRITGPVSYEPAWTVTSSFNSVFGNSVFVCGDRFVTSRTMFAPVYNGVIECRRVSDGSLLWQFQPESTAIMYAVGFDEHAVYAHDYNSGAFYAIDPLTANVKWTFPYLYLFGGNTGVVFSCEGDPMYTNYRFDRANGEPVWQNNYILPVTPNAGFAFSGSTFYHYTGSIVTPKTIIAIDAKTGEIKYQTIELPGDGDQEEPITMGPGNRIYMKRDGANFWAFKDDGTELKHVFNTSNAFNWYVAIDHDSTIVGCFNNKIHRMDDETGEILASSPFDLVTTRPLISIDALGKIYVNIAQAGPGKIYCISPDLQTILWETPAPYGYYCDPNLTKDGLMILTRSGNQITGVRSEAQVSTLPPVADFYTWTRDINLNGSVNFFDHSSYLPTSWEWTFEGGTPQISTEQNPTGIQYTFPGSYQVTLKVTNQFGEDIAAKSCYINVDETVAVKEIAREDGFVIYPNPFTDQFILTLTENYQMNFLVSIQDAMGKVVFETKVSTWNEIPVNLSGYKPGLYFVRVAAGGKVFTQKTVKIE